MRGDLEFGKGTCGEWPGLNKRKQSKFEELKMSGFDLSQKAIQLKTGIRAREDGGKLPKCWKFAKKREDFTEKQGFHQEQGSIGESPGSGFETAVPGICFEL